MEIYRKNNKKKRYFYFYKEKKKTRRKSKNYAKPLLCTSCTVHLRRGVEKQRVVIIWIEELSAIHRDRMLTNINSGYGRWWLEWRKYFPLRDHEGSTITGFFTKNRFLFFFSRWQITNVAYSATAEGSVRRMVSQRVKNSEQTVQDEMTISTCTSKGTGKRGEPSSSSTLHGSIVNAPACKSSN